jgi:hypothetical protein
MGALGANFDSAEQQGMAAGSGINNVLLLCALEEMSSKRKGSGSQEGTSDELKNPTLRCRADSLRRHTRVSHHAILSFNLVLKSEGVSHGPEISIVFSERNQLTH